MQARFTSVTRLALMAGSLLITPLAAHAATAPAWLIDKPGTYTLDHDITVTSGDAIMVTASGVNLDLGGHNVIAGTAGQGRGIYVLGAKAVRISNGKVHQFAIDVHFDNTENVTAEGLQIQGANLAALGAAGNPADPRGSGSPGFAEVGFLLTQARGSVVRDSTITSVNAGIFTRGVNSTGCLFQGNTLTGGPTAGADILAVCFNGLPTEGDPGPTACVVQDCHIGHYTHGMLWQGAGTAGMISKNNTISVWGYPYFFPDTAHYSDNVKGTTMVNDTVFPVPAP